MYINENKEKNLLRLEPEDRESLLILSADGEVTATTLEAFRGDMDPSVLPEVFNLKRVQSSSEKQDFIIKIYMSNPYSLSIHRLVF